MKILHRFMLKQFIGPFVLIFLIMVFILLMQFLWKYIDELIGKGLELSIIGEFLLYSAVSLTAMAFPLAVLLASILTLGSMGENYELIALKAAGISLQRIVLPLVILSCVIAISAFAFINNVTPYTNLKMRTLLDGIRHQRPELQLREGMFSNVIDGYSIRIGHKDYKTNQLYELKIYDHTEKLGNVSVILADSGNMMVTSDKRFLEVTLYSGHRYQDMADGKTHKTYPFSHQFFDKEIFRMALPDFDFERSDEQIFKKGYQMMNLNQLTYTVDSLSHILDNQEILLRKMIKPAYQKDYPVPPPPMDSVRRAKIPDDFMPVFDRQSKQKRLTAIQTAIGDIRSQKDQFTVQVYEREGITKQTWRYDVEWHRKFTLSLACIIFFFIGAPLGAIIRKNGLGTPIIIAVLFFVVYYVISMIGEKSAKGGSLLPIWGMWLSTGIVLPISIFLTYLATRDSSIFNQDMYLNHIKKGLAFIFAVRRNPRPQVFVQITEHEQQPEAMIARIEQLSQKCKSYLNKNLKKTLKSKDIWWETKGAEDDRLLAAIGKEYDYLNALLHRSSINGGETVAEYPRVSLRDFRIKIPDWWQFISNYVFWFCYIKAWVQRDSLRSELEQIISANENLINEINASQ
jgi:lipopolysaccharide export system permease protein